MEWDNFVDVSNLWSRYVVIITIYCESDVNVLISDELSLWTSTIMHAIIEAKVTSSNAVDVWFVWLAGWSGSLCRLAINHCNYDDIADSDVNK